MLLAVANQKRTSVIIIDQSTNDGINLFNYFKSKTNRVPRPGETVYFVVNENVNIVAPNTSSAAIVNGDAWPSDSVPVIENRGSILGRGGDGGRGAEWTGSAGITSPNWTDPRRLSLPEDGKDGGTAIKGNMVIENYGLIAGGGGGGAGGGIAIYNTPTNLSPNGVYETIGGTGSGGGAPFGRRAPNANTIESMYQYRVVDGYTPFDYTKEPNTMYMTQTNRVSGITSFLSWYSPAHPWIEKTIPFKDPDFQSTSPVFFLPQYQSDKLHYNLVAYIVESSAIDKTKPSLVYQGLRMYEHHSVTLRQSSDGAMLTGGAYGYGGMGADGTNSDGELVMPNYFESLDLTAHHGGAGGDVGTMGKEGVNTNKTTLKKLKGRFSDVYRLVHILPPAKAGRAGLVTEGNVIINNKPNGVVKGR